VLGYLNYDNVLSARATGMLKFLRDSGVELSELVGQISEYDNPRKIFERQIRYWNCRPMPADARAVVCPADARALVGSMAQASGLYIKHKFFSFAELLGEASGWQSAFADGDYALFRLTPEKYHYTHAPVSGRVLDFYAVEGRYHPCNPNAAVQLITPVSKNRRTVTILDTDCDDGTGIGQVAMIEVVALMIGRVEQRYSEERYESPREIARGIFLRRGSPKALFRPGSSTVVLLFQKERVRFAPDLIANQHRSGVNTCFSMTVGQPLTETDVRVRSLLALPAEEGRC
jgi:phosphatidylserine decarboxylase